RACDRNADLRRRSVHRYSPHTARQKDAVAALADLSDVAAGARAQEQTSAFHRVHAERATIAASTTLFLVSASVLIYDGPPPGERQRALHLNCHFTAGLINVWRRKFFSGRSHLAMLRNRNTGTDRFITTMSIAS